MYPISSTLSKIAAELLRSAPPEEAPLLAWPMVCGGAVAQKTQAVSFVDGNLTIGVPDAAWKAQLQGFVPAYLEALQRLCPTKIQQIRFSVDAGSAMSSAANQQH